MQNLKLNIKLKNTKKLVVLQKLVIVAILLSVVLGFSSAILFQAFYNYLAKGVFTLSATTGMTFYGGFIGGAITFLLVWFIGGKFFLKKENSGEEKRKIFDMLDISACCIPLAHAIGRIGCFFAGCCHGAKTDAWFGVNMFTQNGWETVVPVQLFESAFLILLSAFLLWVFFKRKINLPLMPTYCFAYGIWRFFIEYARADHRGKTVLSFLSPSQLVAVMMIVAGITYFCVWYMQKRKKEGKNDER